MRSAGYLILLLLMNLGAEAAPEVTEEQKKAINRRFQELERALTDHKLSALPNLVNPSSLRAYMTEVKSRINRHYLNVGEKQTKQIWGIRDDFEEFMALRDPNTFFKKLRFNEEAWKKTQDDVQKGNPFRELEEPNLDLIPGKVISFAPKSENEIFAIVETGSLKTGVEYFVFPMEWVKGKWLFDIGPTVVRRAKDRFYGKGGTLPAIEIELP